jgi:ribosomal protein S18 acetylase RimI-like enzyme
MDRPAQAIIRQATSRDLPSLEWGGEYQHYRRVFARAMQEAERGRRILLLAEIGAELAGQIFIQLDTRPSIASGETSSGYLYAFRVKMRYRNRGIGAQLLAEAETMLASMGYSRSVISVSKTNPSARRLYERHDYQVFGEDPGEWSYVDHLGEVRQVREPAYVMEKWI